MTKQPQKTIHVTFTRETVAEADIPVPEGFDPMSDTYEDVARDWLDVIENYESLEFDHDGCDVEVWNIDGPTPRADDGEGTPDEAPVPATVTLQRWVLDYATEVDEVLFDCRKALDAIPLGDLPAFADGFHDGGACNFGDNIFHEAVRLRLTDDWDGPFELYIADDDAYAAYYDGRAAEAGLPPVER